MGRTPCCDKENVKRGPWSSEEDAKLKDFIHKYGTGGNWIALPHKAGLKRCGKSCRLRWLNYLRPNIKHGEFTDAEDKIICSFYASIGSRWSIIAAQLPGRTDNDIKNYWNTKLKKKLMSMLPSFQKKPSLFPSIPLQSSSTYNPPLMTSNSSSFYSYTNPNFTNVNNFNSLLTPTTDLSPPLPVPDSNSLISLVTNNAINGENENSFYLGFQEDDYSTYMKEGMLMFGGVAGAGTAGGGGLEVSTTCSSSEGGSYTSQISYGDYSNNHHQIKQEDQFALRSYTINDYKDQKPEGYLRNYETPLLNDLEEVKQLLSNDKNNGYLLDDDDDKNKATHDDHEGICYYY